MNQAYPKRLIEVDLPIKRISAHARREKSIRHGHISTLHIWWARRPLAACRAVICASLWPDPADPNCPQVFRDVALKHMLGFANATQSDTRLSKICDDGSWQRYMRLSHGLDIDTSSLKGQIKLRAYLLDFIADCSAWEASTNHWFLETARALTQAAHEALGGEKGSKSLVVDPFAGGGAIPLEALRVGSDAFASDLNPVPVLLNRVVLEYIPKYGQKLADAVRKWGKWVNEQAEQELSDFYPKEMEGATPIAYLWARTIKCEGPSCRAVVPLFRSLWLAKRNGDSVGLRVVPNHEECRVDFEVIPNARQSDVRDGTVKRGAVTCPLCGYTNPITAIRVQLKARHGGARDAQLVAVVTTHASESGRTYRVARPADMDALAGIPDRLKQLEAHRDPASPAPIPDEHIPLTELRRVSLPLYGMTRWGDILSPRQGLAMTTAARLISRAVDSIRAETADPMLATAVASCLGIVLGRLADFQSSLATWSASGEFIGHTFTRQALGMVWDYAESNPWADAGGSWRGAVEWVTRVIESESSSRGQAGTVERASATSHPLPDDTAHAVITDPPYYDAVPYAHLSDFFYVWHRRALRNVHPDLYIDPLVAKEQEIVVDRPHTLSKSMKTIQFYEDQLGLAFNEVRRVLRPSGVATIVFASKTTASWEAILQAIVDAHFVITASWPIDTEREARMAAQGQARLGSSIHIVCRPRERDDGSVRANEIGDWRDVLAELPKRVREWMRRLSGEGVVGADAIFACLGPALEIFSRYSRVEKASGEQVMLKEYLTYVWGAVAQEALAQIFKDADASGFEEDARLTAMWLWTLNAGAPANGRAAEAADAETEEASDEDEDMVASTSGKPSGYVLEFDAARKIAQGLGAHLEELSGVVEVKGDKARLLSVPERTRRLFGKDEAEAPQAKRKKTDKQMKLFSLDEVESAEGGWGDKSVPKLGDTVLDRIHQSMILFAAGRGEALRRFLVEDAAGQDQRFWKLANALSALYPQGTEEKRWVDGVLARKKGLGL